MQMKIIIERRCTSLPIIVITECRQHILYITLSIFFNELPIIYKILLYLNAIIIINYNNRLWSLPYITGDMS